MTERTYAMNADLMDDVYDILKGAIISNNALDRLRTAIKDKQPKPCIKWAVGLKVRRKNWPTDNFLTCCISTDRCTQYFVAWDNLVHTWWPGFSSYTNEFNEDWEVYER